MNKPIRLQSCPKKWNRELDKACSPAETLARIKARLAENGADVVSKIRRVDIGRLQIPVYMSICGADAAAVIPARKQMGKGATPEQAQASALMELMERYAFFSFWERKPQMRKMSWSDAEAVFGEELEPIQELPASVRENMSMDDARRAFDLLSWSFYPATSLKTGKIVWLPLDWFRLLGEFNGSSAGNTQEESILQGVCELIERHVCAEATRLMPVLPTIDPDSCDDPVLRDLIHKFSSAGVKLILKDMSMGLPVPTVAALAWDPLTFPAASEIVFTAGTATSPAKAAIRAITEVAQLGGDFCSNSCYEASGLPKFSQLHEIAPLLAGPIVSLSSLPDASAEDLRDELAEIVKALPVEIYAIETTRPDLGTPSHWCIAPGLQFRERDRNQSLGLFIGRRLTEEEPLEKALHGLEELQKIYGGAHFLPFFRGLAYLKEGDPETATRHFLDSIPLQPDEEARAMAEFYVGYAHFQLENWDAALAHFKQSLELSPQTRDYASFLGLAHFRKGDVGSAEQAFDQALKLDKGSAVDLANRGICRKNLGRLEEAEEDLTAALNLDPTLDFAKSHLSALQNRTR